MYNTIFNGYGKANLFELMASSLTDMIKSGIAFPDVFTLNSVIGSYGSCGKLKKMEKWFEEFQMKHEGVKPTTFTYCSLVSAYSRAGLLEKVDSIMRQVENSDVVLDTPFFNCIISAYGQTGDIERMLALFLEMKVRKCKPDYITFCTTIQAYNSQGLPEVANDLKTKMITSCGTLGTHTIQPLFFLVHIIFAS
ncbi:hypothetical protein K7X08_006856 [Anisodus acutangulus]|uniref:Pentatricopeptide repeat-containing protein n=1 Tax=Anisodus acutangulus TaxID=402998 RepID=A0A9Q1LCZ1_9SOLA|nr:hypothetical protein K7X08_006856 [Anisodus acutangulus]